MAPDWRLFSTGDACRLFNPLVFKREREGSSMDSALAALLVSDHQFTGLTLATTLAAVLKDLNPTIQTCSVEEASARLGAQQVDVVVVEALFGFRAGLATTATIRAQCHDMRIIVVGYSSEDSSVFAAVLAGADGYLSDSMAESEVRSTLLQVINGELGIPGRSARALMRRLAQTATSNRIEATAGVAARLTQREKEVLRLFLRGTRSREIATQLCIAESTVNRHIQNIFEKLQVHSRVQAAFLLLPAQHASAPPDDPALATAYDLSMINHLEQIDARQVDA
jgi:DNA-binding NarL/FixJ family response regulator